MTQPHGERVFCPRCGMEATTMMEPCINCNFPEAPKSGRWVVGTWPKNDLRRAFVEGASWWEWYKEKATMWPSDRDLAEEEAEKRFPKGERR